MIYYGYEGGSKLTSYVTTRGIKTFLVCYNEWGSKPPL